MKRNITVKLDADILKQIKVLAAQGDTSVSALLSAKLAEVAAESTSYEKSRRRALARLRRGLDLGWQPPTSREELHER